MDKIINKKISKKLIIIILIVMLFNFAMPKTSYAFDGGIFFKPIAQFIAHIADLIIIGLQTYFIGNGDMVIPGDYIIRYSPGIIFSGTLPLFDINFVSPMPDYRVKGVIYEFSEQSGDSGGELETITYTRKELGYDEDESVEYDKILRHLFDEAQDGIGQFTDKEGRLLLNIDVSNEGGIPPKTDDILGNWNLPVTVKDVLEHISGDISDINGVSLKDYTNGKNLSNSTDPDSRYEDIKNVTYNGTNYGNLHLTASGYSKSWSPESGNTDSTLELRVMNYTFDEDGDIYNTLTDTVGGAYVEFKFKNIVQVKLATTGVGGPINKTIKIKSEKAFNADKIVKELIEDGSVRDENGVIIFTTFPWDTNSSNSLTALENRTLVNYNFI